jgi:predicted amidohydrolase YtcJ
MAHHYTILHGGTVLTFDGASPTDFATRARGGGSAVPDAAGRRATALCYAHERILAVGSDAEILALAGPASSVVDLAGRAVLPGFVDPHAHPFWEGFAAGLGFVGGRERRVALRSLPGLAERLDPDAWLVARYDPTGWDLPDDPTRDELDRAFPDRPALLAHVSGHAVAANSLALALAGVGRDAGDPMGVVRGTDAWDLFAAAMPAPDSAAGVAALARAAERLAAGGVTSVADADVGATAGLVAELTAWGDALASGAMPLAVTLLPGLVRLAPEPAEPVPTPADLAERLPAPARERIRLSHVKLKADGALTTRTAWLREPYADSPQAGGPVHEPAALARRIANAAAAGWASAVHAIGDAAVAAVLDAFEAVPPPAGLRHRIEHVMLLDEELVARLAAGRWWAVVQPEFLAWAGSTYRARLGAGRAARLLPFGAMLSAEIPLAFSSDRPVVPGAPLDGIRAALRHDPVLSVTEALHAWTAAGAAVLGDQDAGRLAVGARSDLVILSSDPTAVPRSAWATGEDGIRVAATIAAGRVVHGSLEADR